MVGQILYACGQDVLNDCHNRCNTNITDDADDKTDNAEGEVIDKHFQTRLYLAFDRLIELLENPCGERAENHAAYQHGDICANDCTHRGKGADDAAAPSVDVGAGCVADQYRQQIGQDRGYQLVQVRVRTPACVNEQRGQKSPSNKYADIRHNHCTQKGTEFLNLCLRFLSTHSCSSLSFSYIL